MKCRWASGQLGGLEALDGDVEGRAAADRV